MCLRSTVLDHNLCVYECVCGRGGEEGGGKRERERGR